MEKMIKEDETLKQIFYIEEDDKPKSIKDDEIADN